MKQSRQERGKVCVYVGGEREREREREREGKHKKHDIRLSIYNDVVGPVEMKRCLLVEKKLVCS